MIWVNFDVSQFLGDIFKAILLPYTSSFWKNRIPPLPIQPESESCLIIHDLISIPSFWTNLTTNGNLFFFHRPMVSLNGQLLVAG